MKAKAQRFLSMVTSVIMKKQIFVMVIGVSLICLLYQPAVAGESYPFHFGPPVKVMTQNLYVGADIFYPAGAGSYEEFLQRLDETFAVIAKTNIYERAKAIAKEVAHQNPHLIGLQEAYTIVRADSGNPSNALDLDYLSILTDALEAKGLDYQVVVKQENLNLSLPIPNGYVALIDHDVILARNDVRTREPFFGIYAAKLPVTLPFGSIDIPRGFLGVIAEISGKEYVFVNTHLEERGKDFDPENPNPYVDALHAAQASELIQVLAHKPAPIILVGDLNSSPEDTVIDLPGVGEIIPPYKQISMSGYADVWKNSLFNGRNPGFTCCQAEDLSNKKSLLKERIDYIFVGNRPGSRSFSIVGPALAELIGEEQKDKTAPSRLWPSDHAGVVGIMLIPTFK